MERIPTEQWEIFECVLRGLRKNRVNVAIGGAVAYAAYTGRERNTKDLDLYVVPEDRDAAVASLSKCGLTDYFDELPYDRKWIYRGKKDAAIVDIIFAMANNRTLVTPDWLDRAGAATVRGQEFRIIQPEELIWSKLYVLQRERCDWPDILNVIEAVGPDMEWDHLLDLVGDDRPLVRSLISIYSWMTPDSARRLPKSLWHKLDLPQPGRWEHGDRVHLLDTRPWFGKAA